MLPYEQKNQIFTKYVFIRTLCAVKSYNKSSKFSLLKPHNRFATLQNVVALLITCVKSVQKFAVWVCQVATVVMETTQLVPGQFKKILSHELRIE